MATSGSIDFTLTKNNIIQIVLQKIQAYGIGETITAEDVDLCSKLLNMIVGKIQKNDNNVWVKETATIFPQKSQRDYKLYGSSSDHATADEYADTTLSDDFIATNTALEVVSSSDMTVGDYIGIVEDDDTMHWDIIDSIPDSTHVTITTGLASAASSGNKVYTYTNKLKQPFNIYDSIRTNSGTSVVLDQLAYKTWFTLPNKDSSGVPINYVYDRQRDYGVIKFWPVPENVDNIISISYARKIEDFDASSNTPDFPQEWLDTLVNMLSFVAAPYFGKNQKTYQYDYEESLALSLDFDADPGSVTLQPWEY